jgi:peptidoglycan/LPS O-acetylase OafA/YrhL
MSIHLITFALALLAVIAFRVHPSPSHAFMPRRYAIATAAGVAAAAGALVVLKDGLTYETFTAVALLGVFALFLAYPVIQQHRGQPIKRSVVLALAVCIVFGTYVQLAPKFDAASSAPPAAASQGATKEIR